MFHSQHLFLGVCVVRDVNELSNLGWIDFLIFTAQRNNIVLREYKKIRSKLKRKANKEILGSESFARWLVSLALALDIERYHHHCISQ